MRISCGAGLAYMVVSSINGRLLIDVGYTLPEVESLMRGVGGIGQRALRILPGPGRSERI